MSVPGTREVLDRLIGDHIIACRRSVATSRSHLGPLTRTLRSEVSLRVVELHAMFKVRRMRRLVVYMHECTLDFRQLLNLDLQSLSYVVPACTFSLCMCTSIRRENLRVCVIREAARDTCVVRALLLLTL